MPDEEGYIEEARTFQPVAAIVPDQVGVVVLATTAIVTQNANETVIDFVSRVVRPYQIVARVVLPRTVFPRLVAALKENVEIYEEQFGSLLTTSATAEESNEPTRQPESTAPTIAEIYDELKLPVSLNSGAYANTVTIGHTHAEFWLDFITNFYPRASVSCRVFIAAGQISRILKTLSRNSPMSND